jgi:outer membrane receptor for ferrienterochelin and colicin
MKKWIILLPLAFLAAQISAQDVVGRVVTVCAKHGFDALPGATVYWENTQIGAATNDEGEFVLPLTDKTNVLIVSFVGYTTYSVEYNGEEFLEVVMEEGEQLDAAEVEAVRQSTEISLIDPLIAQTLSREELCKAACCNLSEAFETNASVDAAFTDAVTGTRQIRMLGLDGKYTQIMTDNMPSVRGLSSIYGLTYVPGTWINQIFISKGAGSVTSGYESITGQINVAMLNPDNAEKAHINVYGNQGGRIELNGHFNQKVGDHWGTILLGHGEFNNQRIDNNGDGFLDNPLKQDFIVRNEWHYRGDGGMGGQYMVSWMESDQTSGQTEYDPYLEILNNIWGAHIRTSRLEASAKTGFVFRDKEWKSFGSQLSALKHNQESSFGSTNYVGEQITFRGNLLYASIIGNTDHKFTTGVSYVYDDFDEQLDTTRYLRTEQVPGAFFEYSWTNLEVLSLIAGIRVDQNNLYGLIVTPRLHFRYSLNENIALKLAAGKGFRSPNVIMENVGLLASSRQWVIAAEEEQPGFGLKPEEAWNFGVNYTHKFQLNYRDAALAVDFYRTEFVDQVVVDLETAGEARFYNLSGQSYSNSAQAEFSWTPFRRFEMRIAYRWLDVQADYAKGQLQKPLVASHRAFLNLGYQTKQNEKEGQWKFDLTTQVVGDKRIPNTQDNPEQYELPVRSDPYMVMNAQITRVFGPSFELYLGAENLTNYRQPNAILAAEDPQSEFFDASLIWGPVFGRMVYGGLRWNIE